MANKDAVDTVDAHGQEGLEEASGLNINPVIRTEIGSNPNLGHRDRLRERFVRGGYGALADYELLELLLYRSIPRRDTKKLAKDLLKRFGSIGGVMGASIDQLCEIKGIGQNSAIDLKIINGIARESARDSMNQRAVLSNWSAVLDYCQTAMAHEPREQFRVLFLDKKNALIADEVQQTGTVDHTPVYPREILRRCVNLDATAVILVHNHPSGDPTPSSADITMTKKIIAALEPLNITVHDHIIVGKSAHTSLRGIGLI